MSRYIDADKLVTHLKDELEGCKQPVGGRACGKSIAYGTALGLTMAISFAETLPTADVVEVVRCKDCRYCEEAHYEEEGEMPYIKLKCKWSNYSHQPNDFCSYGERSKK